MADSPISDTPPPRSTSSPRPANLNGGSTLNHRSSFAENLRHSPRSQRHPSFTQAGVQELLNHHPSGAGDPRFVGRDWRNIRVGELVSRADVKWAQLDTPVEVVTKALTESGPSNANVILLRERPDQTTAVDTFDFNDLNAYLLVVVGLARPEKDQVAAWDELTERTNAQLPIPVRDITTLAKKSPLVTFPESMDLSKAIEVFASGVHRIIVCKEGTQEVIGVLSQLKLVKFLWDNGTSFHAIDSLYPMILRDLGIGTAQTVCINGDKPLADALTLMSHEGLTSVAVVDNALNVVGNISTADVKLLTSTSSLPLLQQSCIHFISVILSERGVENGKDSFPVFHVNPYSTLAHTVAKLVATRSHRMWVVESASPSPSTPATPLATPSIAHAVLSSAPAMPQLPAAGPTSPALGSTPSSPSMNSVFPSSAVSAAAFPGARISGRLTGVISLTDILNLFARQSGLHPLSPHDSRERRRRSSSSSLRPSFDSARNSNVDIRR